MRYDAPGLDGVPRVPGIRPTRAAGRGYAVVLMSDGRAVELLRFEAPYDWPALIGFLAARAIPGVEQVEPNRYRRAIAAGRHGGVLEVGYERGRPSLELRVSSSTPVTTDVLARVRRLFDLDADPAVIRRHLGRDRRLAAACRAHPGIRLPGAWDPFELAVRAILGQQVSVRAASTLAGRVASAHGTPISPDGAVSRLFPTAAQLTDAPLERLGVMPARAAAIRGLARAVADGTIRFGDDAPVRELGRALQQLPGIGPWTAAYIAMRALGDPDAMPAGDLVLRQVTGAATTRELEVLSQPWRPWRSYAVMLLWHTAARPAPRPVRRSRGR
jgi:AraC family transcriptional regulator of adaptative response / DNA-3-methyladenine glycosylase II